MIDPQLLPSSAFKFVCAPDDPEVMLRAVESPQSATNSIAARWRSEKAVDQTDLFSGTWSYIAVLAWVIFLGATVRLPAILFSSFPANDGGMFMQAVIQLKNAHFVLPQTLNYNGLQLPNAYPPLGFYVAGLMSAITHQSVVTMLRFIPVSFSILTIVAFILLAQSFLNNRATVVASALAFALVPRSHNWEVMGGGLTRSIGFFFAVLAIWQIYLLFTDRARSHLLWTIVFASLACLSHLEMALFVALSAAVMLVYFARTRQGLIDAAIVAGGVLLLTSPWWIVAVGRYGITPFISAGGASDHSLARFFALLFTFNWADERVFPVFVALSALGALVCLLRRDYFLLLWIAVDFVVDPRKFKTEAMVPLSLIVGMCLVEFLFPLVKGRINTGVSGQIRTTSGPSSAPVPPAKWIAPVLVGILVTYGWMGSVVATATEDINLSSSERRAMEWVRSSTSSNSRFAIVTGDDWSLDRTSEWFPALADRVSVATVQGYEWLPNQAYAQQVKSYTDLQKCTAEAPSCITEWRTTYKQKFDYLYIAQRPPMGETAASHTSNDSALVDALSHDSNYALVFENSDAAIFRVLRSEPASFSIPVENSSAKLS